MKAQVRQSKAVSQQTSTQPAKGVPPTLDEIRQRAHALFLARDGTPGNELDDWLRAEQELKEERRENQPRNHR